MASKPASSAMADILGPSYLKKTKSTISDQGDQSEQTNSSASEPVSGVQGAGTKDEPYDQGNQEEQSEGARPTVNGNGVAKPPAEDDRGRPAEKWPTRSYNPERSVSPGQLADGTHVLTSGDNGQAYQPAGNALGKLKNRLHIGSK